jgi:cytoskeletal protein CcmA (bactofilin family)
LNKEPEKKALVVCPRCGHQQSEPRAAISSNCRQCGEYLRIQELLNPIAKEAEKTVELRRVNCFDCGTELDVPAAAKSAMCKRCSSYIDLQDYTINNAVSKNFKTKGKFVVESKGYVFNTDIVARDIVVKGRVHGKVAAEQSLTIFSGGEIKGPFRTPLLIVPADSVFHCTDVLKVGAVKISGEVVGDIHAETTITVRATGRLFGNVIARNLVVEAGAIVVGQCRVGITRAV